MAHDVFISYSSKDKSVADAARAVLEETGIRCWIAPRDIIPGREWAESIIEAINAARVMVLVFSDHCNTSAQIVREVDWAINRRITVVPMRIEDVQPTARLAYYINTPHWLDAFPPPLDQHLRHLVEAVRGGMAVLDKSSPRPPPDLHDLVLENPQSGALAASPIPGRLTADSGRKQSAATPTIIGACVAGLVAMALTGYFVWLSTPVKPVLTAEPAQQPAISAPEVFPPLTTDVPTPKPSPLERARTAALSLPCALLTLSDGPRISGLAQSGQNLDRLLADLRSIGPLTDSIVRVGIFACAPIAAVSGFVRRTWDTVPPSFVLRPAETVVISGERLALDVTTALPVLYMDLYQNDGSVRHLTQPAGPHAAISPHLEFVSGPGAGPALLVAIGAAAALDLGVRPQMEKAADYLAVLRPRLQDARRRPFADVAIIMVRPAEPIVAKPSPSEPAAVKIHREAVTVAPPRPLRSSNCSRMISRAQLGEALSNEELTALRTKCGS